MWIGNTPAWIDRFFSKDVIPPAVFAKFYWATGLPYWGEDLPGMDEFMKAWDAYGKEMGNKDFYILASYGAGLAQIETLRRAIESDDVSRDGYVKAMKSIKAYTAGGLTQPLNLSKVPYESGVLTRILQPDMAAASWKSVADYAEPAAAPAGGAK